MLCLLPLIGTLAPSPTGKPSAAVCKSCCRPPKFICRWGIEIRDESHAFADLLAWQRSIWSQLHSKIESKMKTVIKIALAS